MEGVYITCDLMGFLAHDFGGRDGNGRHAASDDVVHRDAVMLLFLMLLLMCWWCCLLFVIYLSGGLGLGSEVLVASPRKVERQTLARIM